MARAGSMQDGAAVREDSPLGARGILSSPWTGLLKLGSEEQLRWSLGPKTEGSKEEPQVVMDRNLVLPWPAGHTKSRQRVCPTPNPGIPSDLFVPVPSAGRVGWEPQDGA